MSGAALEASGIGVRRGGRWLLQDVACALRPGTVTAVVGPNGAGKSTLLGVLSGAIRPDAGEVHLHGELLWHLRPDALARRRAAMGQQARSQFAFSVRQVVALGLLPWRQGRAAENSAVQRAMQAAGVDHLAARSIAMLSGGETARVHFARLLAQHQPAGPGAVVLLDEPTASLDVAHRAMLLRRLRALAGRGAAVAVVLHDLNEARFVADRAALLQDGKLVAFGPCAQVLTASILEHVYGLPFLVGPHAILPILDAAVAGASDGSRR